jgi:hypothetical protein
LSRDIADVFLRASVARFIRQTLDDVFDSLAGELLDVAGSVRNEQLIENSLRP